MNSVVSPPPDQSELENLKSELEQDDLAGSVVINPDDSAAAIVIKYLEAAAAAKAGRNPQ